MSALNQTWRDLQVLVCDNASNDETQAIVAELARDDARIHYICHTQNIGMLANYEFGIRSIQTEFFSFLSDDDLLLPCFCEIAMNGFAQFSEIGFFAASCVSVSKQQGVICVPLEAWGREGVFHTQEGVLELIGKYPIPTTVLFKTAAALAVKIDFQNPLAWDCDFLIQLASRYPFAISKKLCGIFVHHNDSFSGNQCFTSFVDAMERLISRIQSCSSIAASVKPSIIMKLREWVYHTSFASMISDMLERKFKNAQEKCRYLCSNFFRKRVVLYMILANLLARFPFLGALLRRQPPPKMANWGEYEIYEKMVEDLPHFRCKQ